MGAQRRGRAVQLDRGARSPRLRQPGAAHRPGCGGRGDRAGTACRAGGGRSIAGERRHAGEAGQHRVGAGRWTPHPWPRCRPQTRRLRAVPDPVRRAGPAARRAAGGPSAPFEPGRGSDPRWAGRGGARAHGPLLGRLLPQRRTAASLPGRGRPGAHRLERQRSPGSPAPLGAGLLCIRAWRGRGRHRRAAPLLRIHRRLRGPNSGRPSDLRGRAGGAVLGLRRGGLRRAGPLSNGGRAGPGRPAGERGCGSSISVLHPRNGGRCRRGAQQAPRRFYRR